MINTETSWILEALRRWVAGATEHAIFLDGLHPEQLGDQLEWNRLLPLFHQLPINCPDTGAWNAFRIRMAEAYQRNLLRSLQQLRSGTQLMRQLEHEGIPCLAMRGPFLALDVYGDPAARLGADIDLLVPRRARRHAWQVCQAQGYHSLDWECPLWPVDAHRIHWRLQKEGDPSVCELHWAVEPVYGVMTLRYDRLFKRPVQMTGDGFEWQQPDPENMLLLLCRHTARHLEDAQHAQSISVRSGAEALEQRMLFRWLDVAVFLRKYGSQLDWDWLSRQAADRRLGQSLVVSLEGVRDWLGMPLPDAAERYLPVWAGAVQAQRSSIARARLELWWERKAGPAVGLQESSLEDILYFLFPHALFFAPAQGVGLVLRRMGHGVSTLATLLVASLSWCGFVAITAVRRACMTRRRSFPATLTHLERETS